MTSIGGIPHGEGDLERGRVLPEEMEMRVRTQTVLLGKRWSMCAWLEILLPKARERGCQSKTSRRAVAESATWLESCQELQKFCIALCPVVLFLPFNAVE